MSVGRSNPNILNPSYAPRPQFSFEQHNALRSHTAAERLALAKAQNESVVCLDLDQCSLIGEDTYDILRLLSTLNEYYMAQPGSGEVLLKNNPKFAGILQLLVNPELIKAVHRLSRDSELGYTPTLVFYTAKGGLVRAPLQNPDVAKYFGPHSGGRVVEPRRLEIELSGGSITEGCDYLQSHLRDETGKQIPSGLYKNYQRLSFGNYAVANALNLPYIPQTIVTGFGNKDLRVVSSILGVPFEKLILFDDRTPSHVAALRMEPVAARMIPVLAYNFKTMDPRDKAELERRLNDMYDTYKIGAALATKQQLFSEVSSPTNEWPASQLILTKEYQWKLGQDDPQTRMQIDNGPWQVPAREYVDADVNDRAAKYAASYSRYANSRSFTA